MTDTPASLPLAVSMGEPAGIGTEILFSAYKHFSEMPPERGPTFYLIDDPVRVEKRIRDLGLSIKLSTIDTPDDAPKLFQDALPVMPLREEDLALLADVTPGAPNPTSARAVTSSIEMAVAHAGEKQAGGVVTLPIQKSVLQEAGFEFSGHTDFLEHLTRDFDAPAGFLRGAVMILTAGPFRVVPVTVHLPLAKVPQALSSELIFNTCMITAQSLVRDYGIQAPRIAVAGLNPHAGEDGQMGTEERDIIAPAIMALRDKGIDAFGPIPGDTLFHEEARAQYHTALTMYHDQGLIPIKTIAFYAAVNTTLGLPIVRTSPDHGTALQLVGKGVARADSLINSIYSADRIAKARASFDQHYHG